MLADPKKCRENARYCAELASTAAMPKMTEHFARLAKSWIRLASEIEASEALLQGMNALAGSQGRQDGRPPDKYRE